MLFTINDVKRFRLRAHMHLHMIFLNISFTYYEQKQTTRFKESETVILDFRRLRSGQVWEQQSQEKHWYRGREKEGGGGLLGG